MSMDGDSEQAMLAESARRYGERGYGPTQRAASEAHAHGCLPERWREFAEMGWLTLPLPERDDGLGGSMEDLCVLGEELGRMLVVEPWVACAVLAAPLLSACASEAQRASWMGALAGGDKRIAFAPWEPGSRFELACAATRAERMGDGDSLSGVKELVCGAPGCDALLIAGMCDNGSNGVQPALFLVDAAAPGLSMQTHKLADGRHAARVTLNNVFVPAQARLNDAGDLMAVLQLAMDRAVLAQCAETIGAMAKALEMTLDYLKTRKQFGRLLAGNQALQHRLVDMHVAIEETRALAHGAAQAFDGPRRTTLVAAAKAFTAQAARQVWEEAVQMHGAIGTTEEYALGRYARHLAVAHTLYGDLEMHLERLARAEDVLQG